MMTDLSVTTDIIRQQYSRQVLESEVQAAIVKVGQPGQFKGKAASLVKWEIWDQKSPINGVSAEDIISSRTDIPAGGEVYLVYIGGQLTYFQPHVPGETGNKKITRGDITQVATKHVSDIVDQLASNLWIQGIAQAMGLT